MALLVSDSNIFIDAEVAEITKLMFRLPDTFVVPNVLYHEELSQYHPELPGLGLQIEQLNEDVVVETIRLRTIYLEPSTNDIMALALAKNKAWRLYKGGTGKTAGKI